jgi:uncharacterized protein (TIGR03437 family)
MIQRSPGPSSSLRHSWGSSPQLLLLALWTNVLSAANLPTFTYSISSLQVNAIATDSAGDTYLAGGTSVPFAITPTPGAFQSQINQGTCGTVAMSGAPLSCNDAVVIKLDPTGAVIFATYLGGSGNDIANGIAVDQQGNIYVAGATSMNVDGTNTFPVTPGAAFTNPATAYGFIAKLNPSGSQLVYATFIPGASVLALALDLEGNVYITGMGSFQSPLSFPTTAGAFQASAKASGNLSPGIAAKLNASGSALVYATYLSGSGGASSAGDIPSSIAVDPSGDAFIAGWTFSTDFPVTPGAFLSTSPGVRSVFLTKLNPQGSGLAYSTYIGGASGHAVSVRLDAQDTAFVAGATDGSTTFPTAPGEPAGISGAISGFLTRVSADGSSLIYSTLLPTLYATMDVDRAGNASIGGAVYSDLEADYANLPVGVGAFQPNYAGGTSDAYVARFTPEGQLAGATYLGGSSQDDAELIALAPNGSVVITGGTQSADFPGIEQPLPLVGAGFVTSIFISMTVENAASYVASAIAPGEIVSLRGYGIGPANGVSATSPVLPNQLGGVQVSIGGFAAPLLYVQAQQINAQVPWELVGQTSAAVEISYPGVPATPTPVVVTPALPGVFYIQNSDYSFNSPSNPARAGDYVSVYGTGGGSMNPPGVDGAAWPLTPLSSLLTQPVSVTVGSEAAGVLYSGSAPTLESGFFQINVQLPADLTAAAQSLYVTIGGARSAPAAISIQ